MKTLSRLRWRYVIAIGIVLSGTAVSLVWWQANRALRAASQQASIHDFQLRVRDLPPSTSSVEWISTPAAFSTGAIFNGALWLAGASGLFEYDGQGTLVKHYRPGLDIPPSPILKLVIATVSHSREPQLLLATADQGILAFDGSRFRQILPEDPKARSITSLLPLNSGKVLVGTRKLGVLVFDGEYLDRLHPNLADLPVTELAGTESDLWVGTQDRGVIHFQGGRIETFGEEQGLPDRQVFSIVRRGAMTYVGTAAGIAEFREGRFARVLAPGIFAASLVVNDTQLTVAAPRQGVVEIPLASGRRLAAQKPALALPRDAEQLFAVGETTYAIAPNGLYFRDGSRGSWQKAVSTVQSQLADRNVSALAMDDSGRLWVGYFDRGLDIFAPGLRSATHIEDENVFCVNRIVPGRTGDSMAIATANGLVILDSSGRKQRVLLRSDGLLADHITDVANYGDGMVLATPAGLTFLDQAGPRSLYAFHGLINNHVYAVAASGREVIAGTLGGISVLENENITANYNVSSRGLSHNWISGLVRDGDGWIVGTYGGGLVRMTKDGRFEPFEVATGKFEVYPNAMLSAGNRVLAGTLGRGLYVYNRTSGRWTIVTDGLPSLTVTALAFGQGYLYIGTDNGLVRIAEQNLP
ncbi:MAG TPA: hypothetical protein VHN74_08365 [Candidatus Angelobacter sp.]|jgi:ligand-binding sensor domain-containing protein|nr:hypothetical protein [Candidatus Angelobacter sp.]